MATFKVGQRVRVVKSIRPQLIGIEATVINTDYRGWSYPTDTLEIRHDDGAIYACAPYNIEPLQPERNRVIAWEDVPGGRPNAEEIA